MKRKFVSVLFVFLCFNIFSFGVIASDLDIKNSYINILKSYDSENDIYCVYDIDKNNVPELIVKAGTCQADYKYHYYSFIDGKSKKISERYGGHMTLYSYPSGNGVLEYWSHQGPSLVNLVTLESQTLTEKQLMYSDSREINFDTDVALLGSTPILSYDYGKPVNDLTALNDYFSKKTTSTNNTIHYDNIINEVLQIQKYIKDKMYLEAISLCDKTKNSYNLSKEDISLLEGFKKSSQNAYQEYVDSMKRNRTTQYYIYDWGMGYKFFETYEPGYSYYDDYPGPEDITIYYELGESIQIYSYPIGASYGYLCYETVRSPRQYISGFARTYKQTFHQSTWGTGHDASVDILSENDTTVGKFPARQVTLRTSTDLNRYGTSKEYSMVRCTAFQNGKWIYVIVAEKNSYTWGEDFWNKMEMVRNSISFY